MRVVRLYTHQHLAPDTELELEDDIRHYALNVLRLNKRSSLTLFNGDGFDYSCEILNCTKTILRIKILERSSIANESPLAIHLILSVSKSTHMDYAIQKSVEAGVSLIQPVLSERSISKATKKSFENKQQHWQQIIRSACEQCGRAKIPTLSTIAEFNEVKGVAGNENGFIFDFSADKTINDLNIVNPSTIKLIIGPEGGLSENEIKLASDKGFLPVQYGTRVMRTETAAVAAVLFAQTKWGDLAH